LVFANWKSKLGIEYKTKNTDDDLPGRLIEVNKTITRSAVTSVGLGSLKRYIWKEDGQVDGSKKAQVSLILIALNMHIPFHFSNFIAFPKVKQKLYLHSSNVELDEYLLAIM